MDHLLLHAQAWWDAQRFDQPVWQVTAWPEQKLRHIRFCRKVRFLGKIQKYGARNSMTYRLPNARKSNFATEPLADDRNSSSWEI
jgi:hypothetical protein